jgi:CDP-glucose 4,6-dehydratase
MHLGSYGMSDLISNSIVDQRFWSGKRVLITGHTGFKGAWLAVWLNSLGAKVRGIALEPESKECLFSRAELATIIDSKFIDITDLTTLRNSCHEFDPEIIFHLAAQSLVKRGYKEPLLTYQTNVLGSVNLLEIARELNNLRALIVVTSDKCYENRGYKDQSDKTLGEVRAFKEQDRLGGSDPYSNSKACLELICSAYHNSYFNINSTAQGSSAGSDNINVLMATVRAGNVIGPGDTAQDRLLVDLVEAFKRSKIALIRNPKAVRPWQYVLEPLYGYMILAQFLFSNKRDYQGAWNFGPAKDSLMQVDEVADIAAKTWGLNAKWEIDKAHHPHEADFLSVDSSKARSLLDWRTVLSAEQAIKRSVDGYKALLNFQAPDHVHSFLISEIENFQSRQGA